MNSVLIISPHADDEVIGAGGLISGLVDQGARVHALYVVVDGFRHYGLPSQVSLSDRLEEVDCVARILRCNYSIAYQGKGLIEKLDTLPQRELVDLFESAINRHQPDLVLLPHGNDYDQDHRAVYNAAFAAARPIPQRDGKFFPLRIATYESPKLGWMNETFSPNLYADITPYLKRKLDALRAYTSQSRKPPHVRSPENITALATLRGSEFGVQYAEAFCALRWSVL